jgi:hypothetical protein
VRRREVLLAIPHLDFLPDRLNLLSLPATFQPPGFLPFSPVRVLLQVVVDGPPYQGAGVIPERQDALEDGRLPLRAAAWAELPHGVGAGPLVR